MPKVKDANHYNWQQFLILGTLAQFRHFYEQAMITFENIFWRKAQTKWKWTYA
jgi:hypothetical protein